MTVNPGKEIARHLRTLYFGGNWTSVNFHDSLKDLGWKEATTKVESFNTIAELIFHTGYYIHAVTKVLTGGPLDASDKFSFDLPPVHSQEEWKALLDKTWVAVENLAVLIENLDEEKWPDIFVEEKYGSYYRNMTGIIEHSHYHLGQIVLLKKMIMARNQGRNL